MTTSTPAVPARPTHRFVWNFGGWFGSQLGCTLWLLVRGVALFRDDRLAAVLSLLGFALLNGIGVLLWRRRATLAAYTAYQDFFAVLTVVVAALVVLANVNGLATPTPPDPVFTTRMPYWLVAIPPALMLTFAAFHRRGRP